LIIAKVDSPEIVKTFFIALLLTIVNWQICCAQFTDDFSDNDFTSNQSWSGKEIDFTAINAELKLQAPAVASLSYLSTQSAAINNAVWEFYLQMDFNPSSSNFSKIYLISDQANLGGSLNGYFIKAGNTADEVSLYRQDGIVETKIIDGLDGRLNVNPVKVKIKAIRDDAGNWQLFSDIGVTGVYALEGNITDVTYQSSVYFGVYCKYTSTRSDKFHFDNFIVTGDPIPDTTPPHIESLTLVSANELDLKISEIPDEVSAETIANFVVDNAVGNPVTAELQSDQRTVTLIFGKDFPNGIQCSLSVSNVTDLAGNNMNPYQNSFLYFEGKPVSYKDVIVTEIFADPDPQIGLPSAEYLELYNRSSNAVNLQDWTISDGTSTASFPLLILFPGDYLIVTGPSDASLFNSSGKVTGLSNFPSLNNSDDNVILKDIDNIMIDSLHYELTWYKDADKKDGGWALEIIDPDNICNTFDNWIASENETGGTPGKQNSVFANKPDVSGPLVTSVIAISGVELLVEFNEKLDKVAPSVASFMINPSVQIQSLSFTDASLTSLNFLLGNEIKTGTLYTLELQDIYDCAGNGNQPQGKLEFALPESPDSLDIVINEILFNPRPTGVDFVEVYNNSEKYINLKNFAISNFNNHQIENAKTITTSDKLLKPSEYRVFAINANVLKGEYINGREENFLEMSSMPSFNDDEGSVAIVDDKGSVIDHFQYSNTMHSPFIKDDEGVSLERINFSEPTNLIQNWKSASTTVGYATPGYLNSNTASNAVINEEAVKVDPEIFIPVYGHPDFAKINYNFNKGGYVANVNIYDPSGRQIKQLANNEVLGTEGFFRWDGDQDNGNKARVGYYVVAFEIFDDKGMVKTFRKRIVIATRF
jgi:hypothetical protein